MDDIRYGGLKPDRIREASWYIITVFILLDMAAVAFINLVVFRTGVLDFLSRATMGILNSTLVANLLMIAGLIYLFMIRYGKLTWSDLGIKKGRLIAGIAVTAAIWALTQAANLLVGIIGKGTVTIYEGWRIYGAYAMIGTLASQLFGNALFEEMAFRGFLMPQLCKKIKTRRNSMVSAVLISQIIFGLMHIPNRMYNGVPMSQMVASIIIPAALGILFAAVYLVTDNLFLAIGIHSLINMPAPLFNGIEPAWFIILFTVILLFIWPFTLGKPKFTGVNGYGEGANG